MKRFLTIVFTLLFIASVSYAVMENTELPPKQYTCNGITTDFPITFDYNAESDLTVYHVDTDLTVTTWTQDASGDAGYTIVSEEVVANTAPASGTLVIDCETALTQTINLKNNRATAAEVYESALDKLTLQNRDINAKVERAIVAPATETEDISYELPSYEASAYLQWDSTEKELRNATPVSLATTVGTDVGDVVALIDDGSGNGVLPSSQLNLIDEDDMSSDTATQAPTQQSVKAFVETIPPTGSLIMWTTETPPSGYLECDGSAVSRTTYDGLFAVIGELYGVGDGSTTFNLPDMRGVFPRGWDHGAGVDPDAATRTDAGDGSTTGDHVGTRQADEFESHDHDYSKGSAAAYQQGTNTPSGINSNTTDQTDETGGNETRPINVNVMFCIKI